MAVMFVNGSGRHEQSLSRTFHTCFLPSFGSFGQVQGFCWLYWELPPHLNWEILSTKHESEMNLGNNKQNNFTVEFISLNYSIMYLSFLFLNLCTSLMCQDYYLTVCPFLPWIFLYQKLPNSFGSIFTSEEF